MRNTRLWWLLTIALPLAACEDRNDPPTTGNTSTPTSYLAYVQKMIVTAGDDSEPWDIDAVPVEQSEDTDVVDVM